MQKRPGSGKDGGRPDEIIPVDVCAKPSARVPQGFRVIVSQYLVHR